jgi:sugar phosphate isomerase/epimerase
MIDSPITRRAFSKAASLSSLAAASGLVLGCSDEARPFARATAPDAGRFGRVSLNAYCFNSALNDTSKKQPLSSCVATLFDVLDFCRKYGIDAIDPTGYFFPGFPDAPPDSYLDEFKARANELGIAISGTGARNDFAVPNPASRARDVNILRVWCKVAQRLGAPVVRLFAGVVPLGYEQRWEEVATWMASSMRECAAIAEDHGVKLALQNHGDMLRSSRQVLRLLEMIDSDAVGVMNDVGYYSTPDPYVDIEELMPYTISIQLKESVRPVKRENPFYTDLPRLLRIIHRSGYRGYLPIETLPNADQRSGTEPGNYNPSLAVARFLVKVRAALSEVTGEPLVETPAEIICRPGDELD